MNKQKPIQPPYIADFVRDRIGQVWTAEDAAEVMRQWRRIDELAQELVEKARKAKPPPCGRGL